MTARDDFMNHLTANWAATPIFPLDDYVSTDDLPAVASEQIVLLVDFPQVAETIATIAVNDRQGWRERGIIQLMILSPIGGNYTLARQYGEDIRSLLRGRRLGKTVIESVSSFSAVGNQDGKWLSWVAVVSFYRDLFE